MVFNSLVFLIFFIVVLAVHYSPLPVKARKASLLLSNFLFFASYHPPYVLLLAFSTVVDWFLANRIHQAQSTAMRKLWLTGSLLLNLGVLCFFKYATFALTNFQQMLAAMHIMYKPPHLSLILPVGISFYTFQALSYTIDIYRRKIEPEPSLFNFAMFVSFFPHLVAGPILRAKDILPQCRNFHRATWKEFHWGVHLLIWGLFQKVILADQVFAPVANTLFNPAIKVSTFEAWGAALAFTGQIFFDFTGYSTCAIGSALCLGFYIPDNFHFPYGAIGFSDFWRRWHISLSSWLRDYLYIPLGGNRQGPRRTCINLIITMLLGGFWHGAAWNFVAWGGYHGGLLMAERGFTPIASRLKAWLALPVLHIVGWLLTLYAIVISWVLFRAESFSQAWNIIYKMHKFRSLKQLWNTPNIELQNVLLIVGMCLLITAIHFVYRNTKLENIYLATPVLVRGIVLGCLLLSIILFSGNVSGFIYFQF